MITFLVAYLTIYSGFFSPVIEQVARAEATYPIEQADSSPNARATVGLVSRARAVDRLL